MTKKKTNQRPDNSKLIFVLIGFGAVILLGVIALGVNTYRNQQQQEVARQEQIKQNKIKKEKQRPNFKDYQSNDDTGNEQTAALTKVEAQKRLQQDLNYGFKLMTQIGSLSSVKITSKTLSPSQYKQAKKHFDSLDTFNAFNQATNISTPSGANYYGQGGGYKTFKAPKEGSTYKIIGGTSKYSDTSYDNYIFDVYLKYKVGKFNADKYLSVSVDQNSGVITAVKSEGGSNNG